MDEETTEATGHTEKAIKCSGCHEPLRPEERVYAGPYFEVRPSASGKGTYRENLGRSVTHPNHWPPYGGVTHDPSPAWAGLLKDLPDEHRPS